MGFGLLFRLDESSLGSHLNERRVRGEEEGMDDGEESGPVNEISESESEKDAMDEKLALEGVSVADSVHNGSTDSNARATSHESPVEDKSIENGVDGEVSDVARTGVSPVTPELEDLIDRALGLGSTAVSSTKYGLETTHVDLAGEDNHEEKKGTVRDKPYISKAERRKLKKGQDSIVPDAKVDQQKKKGKGNDVSASQTEASVKNGKPDAGKISRGQKGKLKKMKENLLVKFKKMIGESENGNGDAAIDEGKKTCWRYVSIYKVFHFCSEDAPKICYKCKKVGHLSRDCKEHPDHASNGWANSGVERNSHAGMDDTAEMDRVAMEEDDIHEIGEEEKGRLNDVDYLTGNPLPNDILLYAVPVCGPYSAVQSYKYRVKIIPGTAKKGKAAKTAMNLFTHMLEATQREKELMKACTDPELFAAIIGNVKVTAAGLTQLKHKQKKGKKNNSKEKTQKS
ncbi:hypothetical protein Patl1_24811 [Pistacia atlantica]|uniref:Uncharacterized protein n=1 Tax=Pistacia atlantica TaxID=434234 RepID=A0ACC1B1F3_9ROSI|nr:hypothetical protein Patl1_24811 [Pistacia atlantica]